MAIQYSFSIEDELLVVTASGFDESLDEVLEYGMATIQAALQGNCTAILSDETGLEYRLGTFDTFKAAEALANYAPRLNKAAITCNPQYLQDAQFWETVAVNRGLSVRAFLDIGAARSWLQEA